MSLTTGSIAAKAATTRTDIPRPKYGTHERAVNVTVRSAEAFEELQSVTTGGDATITSGKLTRTKRTRSSKQTKTTPIARKIILTTKGCVGIIARSNKLASPSTNTFYVISTNMEQSSDVSKQTHVWHNQADKWLPLDEGDPIPNRLQYKYSAGTAAPQHWRLFIIANPDVASKKGALLVVDSLSGYPNEAIATNVRRWVEFLNVMKYKHDIGIDQNCMPLGVINVPRQVNQSDCGVFLLKNLEHYLRQGPNNGDTIAARTRRQRKGAQTDAIETTDSTDNSIILTPSPQPITVRAMTVVEPAREVLKGRSDTDDEEPVTLRMIILCNPDEELNRIKPIIKLLGDGQATPRVEFGNEVRTARTMSLTTGSIAAKAATTRTDIPRPKYGTHERAVNVTVRSAEAFEELQSVTTGGDATITSGKLTRTKRTRSSKQTKTTPIARKIILTTKGCVGIIARSNKLASPSTNTFYVISTNMEQSSDVSKQTHVWHNQADKWLPLDEGDPIPNRLQYKYSAGTAAPQHWRLFIIANPDVASKKGALLVVDSLSGYPNEAIATNVRRWVEFLNVMKYKHDIGIDQNCMPLGVINVPRQVNQSDCGVFLLKNLEHYLRQGPNNGDTIAARTRRQRKGAQTDAIETTDSTDNSIILTQSPQPITVRAMTVVEPAREVLKGRSDTDDEEPVTLRMIILCNPDEELNRIKPIIKLLGDGQATPRVEFGNGDEWVLLEDDDPYFLYLKAKYLATSGGADGRSPMCGKTKQ
uniref:Ubiquitin-like protease family profile domain-containing protein n=1 Tax=Glossina palpalis gambiensis TaxID=67801 RepID=A0A1B0C5P7_9MUSC